MTLNLVAANDDLVAMASDQRVVEVRGKRRNVADDTRIKIVVLETMAGARLGWTFNGLAEIEGRPMAEWLALALNEIEAWRLDPVEMCRRLAVRASATHAFRRLSPQAHTFVVAGCLGDRTVVGTVHNDDGSGRALNTFRHDLKYRSPVSLISGMDTCVTEEEMQDLLTFAGSDPALVALQGRFEYLIRTGARRVEKPRLCR